MRLVQCHKVNTISQKTAKKIISVIFLSAFLLFLFKEKVLLLKKYFPECIFYKKTGYLFPACGNTRSISAFLHGHFITSLGYNITPIVIMFFLTAFYIEIIACAFGKKLYIIPRNYYFLSVVLSLMTIYYIARNFIPFMTLCTVKGSF